MPTILQPEILLATLKYDFEVMQRENSPNEVRKWYPRGTNCSNGVRLATLVPFEKERRLYLFVRHVILYTFTTDTTRRLVHN